jgi:hypothetical protein
MSTYKGERPHGLTITDCKEGLANVTLHHWTRVFSYVTYFTTFGHFRDSLIPFCMFLVAGWLNLITNAFLCLITCKLGPRIQSVISCYYVCSHQLHSPTTYDNLAQLIGQIIKEGQVFCKRDAGLHAKEKTQPTIKNIC